MHLRKYLAYLVSFVLLLSALTVTVNYVVDPYLMFANKRINGFNAIKAAINTQTWLVKAHHPAHAEWNALLLGNSRVEIGLNPHHRCLKEIGARAYNLGVPGANVEEQLGFAANVLYQQPIKEIFLSVDFSDFLVKLDASESNAGSAGMNFRFMIDGSANPDYAWNAVKEKYQALYTLDALSSSMHTVAMQSPASPDRDDAGFNPANDFADSVNAEGANALFQQKNDNLNAKFSANWSLTLADGTLSPAFEKLDTLLELSKQRGIRLTVFASPFHEDYWSALKAHGLYDDHEAWLAIITERLARYSGNLSFWDFTEAHAFSAETVPAAGVRSGPLKWYWEPVHFRSELGDLMLDTVLKQRCAQAENHFGRQLL